MARYQIITLVDITRTNPGRNETDRKKLAQQSNFNSLIQAIGLRANVEWKRDPQENSGALPRDLEGKATHWVWYFYTERDDIFRKGDSAVALLVEDLHGVPIIADLNNSVDIAPACFNSKGENANIWVYEITEEE